MINKDFYTKEDLEKIDIKELFKEFKETKNKEIRDYLI